MKRTQLCCRAGLGLALALCAGAGLALAQTPARALPAQQGFEATSQLPANYTPEEAAAVAVVEKWIDTTNTKDLAAHMALIDDNVVYRGDPIEYLGRSARGYCSNYSFIWNNTWVRLDELYVVGGPSDTLVVLKRTDQENSPGEGIFAGYRVEVGVFARVKNGKITEWLDEPINVMGPPSTRAANSAAPRFDQSIPAVCMQYPAAAGRPLTPAAQARTPAVPQPAAAPLTSGLLSYATTKPESRFKVGEAMAARAVRGWFAAWQAGNPKLLGSFVDRNAVFRATPTSDIVNGRDALLKAVCSTMGGQLDLTDIHVIGAEKVTFVIARWNKVDAAGRATRMGSFFRVQNGLITEWMDTPLAGADPTVANPNSAACRIVGATLAASAPAPIAQPR